VTGCRLNTSSSRYRQSLVLLLALSVAVGLITLTSTRTPFPDLGLSSLPAGMLWGTLQMFAGSMLTSVLPAALLIGSAAAVTTTLKAWASLTASCCSWFQRGITTESVGTTAQGISANSTDGQRYSFDSIAQWIRDVGFPIVAYILVYIDLRAQIQLLAGKITELCILMGGIK